MIIVMIILMLWSVVGFLISWLDKDGSMPSWLWLVLSGPAIWLIYLSLLLSFVVQKMLGRL